MPRDVIWRGLIALNFIELLREYTKIKDSPFDFSICGGEIAELGLLREQPPAAENWRSCLIGFVGKYTKLSL
jgi:hypothetical protein